MIFGEPGDGMPEKVGTVLGMIVSVGILGIFVLVMAPILGF